MAARKESLAEQLDRTESQSVERCPALHGRDAFAQLSSAQRAAEKGVIEAMQIVQSLWQLECAGRSLQSR